MTVNGYTWRSTVGNRGGIQYIVVNAEARRKAGVKAGDFATITLEPDTEKRQIEIPNPTTRALGTKLSQKLKSLSFTSQERIHRLVFPSQEGRTRARRVEKMKADALVGKSHQLITAVLQSAPRVVTASCMFRDRTLHSPARTA